ncbi:hypothetical protein OIU84_014588 [Salix udensis]|uniref:Uncharacterized protein n=1 Tax=Salix udensis TaxID=889485 RepID=A0AAD6JCA7_9ROSI|nr:hypothetical protein OIU84_014588 [Salix udensis]
MSGFDLSREIFMSLKPRPTNHILNEALLTSSSEGPFFLNQPRLKNEGNFKRSHLPIALLPKRPMNMPTAMNRKIPRRVLEPSFTPKWAGFTVDQKASLFFNLLKTLIESRKTSRVFSQSCKRSTNNNRIC